MKTVTRIVLAWCAAAAWACAQTAPPIMENKGTPMRLPFTCTAADSEQAGLTCSEEEPCPVYVELSGVEAFLSKIYVIGNLHTSDATLFSVLLGSDDGGRTWSEVVDRIRFGALQQIQFVDFENGWIGGTILLGVPHDPFFLVTNDGGKSWDRRPIFDDSRPGVIERFWFDSKSEGVMLVDTHLKHELYETQTGGNSWSLRQTSQAPIRFPRDRAATETARLRPDAKIHGYHIEKREGDRWAPVASFLVEAGKCQN